MPLPCAVGGKDASTTPFLFFLSSLPFVSSLKCLSNTLINTVAG
jgi:hypothetical protein